MEIVRAQGIEARIRVAIGDERAPAEAQRTAFEPPAPCRIAEEHRHRADRRARPAELADSSEIAGQLRGVEYDRRGWLAQAEAQTIHAELSPDDLPARRGKVQRRGA